jgi:hypothetical protein
MLDAGTFTFILKLDARWWMLDAGTFILKLEARSWMLDAGCWNLETECWMLEHLF